MKCPVCGNETLPDTDYEYEICEECFWEYDPIQVDDPDYSGDANHHSLNEYRKMYKKLKSINPAFSCKNEKDMDSIVDWDLGLR